MELGVVITLFNGASWIEETLRCVFAQTVPPDEVVVVDDGSVDDGAERVASFSGVRIVPSLRKRRARYSGLLEVRTPLVAFLDQDDLWHARHLEGLVAALETHADAPAAVAGWAPFYDGEAPSYEPDAEGASRLDPWSTWPITCPVTTPSAVLFRRNALEAAGGWQVDAAPDWEMYMRMTAPATFVRRAATTCGYRIHPNARSAELRRDGFAYLDIQRRGADAVLAHRMERGADAATRAVLERRHSLLDTMERLMRAVAQDDAVAAAEAARRLEDGTREEDDAFVEGVFGVLVYLFCPDDSAEEHARLRAELLDRLRAVWPANARRTRTLLWRHDQPPFRWRRLTRAVLRGRLTQARRQWLGR